MQKAIFLDRDGVINSDVGHYYIYRVEDFVLNEGIVPSLQRFSKAGYFLFVVTNQGGIAKGIYSEKDVDIVHEHLIGLLKKEGITIQKIYYCPHHDSISKCECRKPSPFFIKQAIQEFSLDKNRSYMIGDSQRDVDAARAAGIKGIKIDSNENISTYCDQILNGEL